MELQLWDHQKKAIEEARHSQEFALFFEMGTGKTCTTIQMLRERCAQQKRLLRTLVFCPPVVVENWAREIAKFSKIPSKHVFPLIGTGAKRQKLFFDEAFSKAFDDTGWPKEAIFITNYEALLMPELFKLFLRWQPEAVIFDESHKLKTHNSKRTKLAIELVDGKWSKEHGVWSRPPIKFRYILSGTPILNSPMDIFSQYRVLDSGKTFGPSFFGFRASYFYDRNAGMPKDRHFPDWQIQPGALERMNKLIYCKAMRVRKDECLDLPPLVREEKFVEMTAEQSRLYKEMKKDFITYLGDKAIVAQLAVTKALRLQQIASGFVKFEDGEQRVLSETPKMTALKELLEQLTPEHKVIVWAVFKENYAQIRRVCSDLGILPVELTGETGASQRQQVIDEFQQNPEYRVLIGNPQSGGIGANLTAASYAIFYSRSFSLGDDLQAEARNYRGGSEVHQKITRIDLVTQGTIDELVLQALANKQEIGESMLREWKDNL